MGISTRKVEEVASRLGVRSMSKSEVSRLCSSLDAEAAAFRAQRFDGVRFAYLWLDATYVKCRVDGRSSSQAVVTAIGLDETGHKRFLGVDGIRRWILRGLERVPRGRPRARRRRRRAGRVRRPRRACPPRRSRRRSAAPRGSVASRTSCATWRGASARRRTRDGRARR